MRRGVGISNDLVGRLCSSICTDRFKGVFSADLIPATRLLRDGAGDFAIVVNLATSDRPVGHFVAVCADSRRVCYLDPYGLPHSYQEDVARFLRRCGRPVEDPRRQVQSFDSVYCGLYASLFAAYWDRRADFALDFSDKDYAGNDAKCVDYLKRIVLYYT